MALKRPSAVLGACSKNGSKAIRLGASAKKGAKSIRSIGEYKESLVDWAQELPEGDEETMKKKPAGAKASTHSPAESSVALKAGGGCGGRHRNKNTFWKSVALPENVKRAISGSNCTAMTRIINEAVVERPDGSFWLDLDSVILQDRPTAPLRVMKVPHPV